MASKKGKKVEDSSSESESEDSENEITEDLLLNGDDSSDEEDNYKNVSEVTLKANFNQFIQRNPNIQKDILVAAYILEDFGRKILYDKETREKYYILKAEQLKHDESDFESLKKINFSDKVSSALKKTCKSFSYNPIPDNIKQLITKAVEELDKDSLLRASLKQSHSEFLLPVFYEKFQPIINWIIQDQTDSVIQNSEHKKYYQLTEEKILSSETIKKALVEKVKKTLEEIKNNKKLDEQKRIEEAEKLFGTNISKSIKEYLNDLLKFNPDGRAVNNLVSSILSKEITEYLTDAFIDKKKTKTDINKSYLLKGVLESAETEEIKTITDCTKSKFDKENKEEIIKLKVSRDVLSSFSMFFSEHLKRSLEKEYSSLSQVVLNKSYNDKSEIKSKKDLYTKEHLVYRSATRQGRLGEQEVARNIIFDEAKDLTAQKWQSIKNQEDASKNHISFRGTLQEEVYNLGNYESVLEKIEFFKLLQDIKKNDKEMAGLIRAIWIKGITWTLENWIHDEGKNKDKEYSKTFSWQQKQTLVELVELFFGTEAFRSPSAIAETNMALDLIIAGKLSWKEALTGKTTIGRGGALSFTMKSSEQKAKKDQEKIEGAGGIESGRQLSEDVNLTHSRKHKYGGEPIGRETDGYKEYLFRKKDIVEKWLELQEEIQQEKQKTEQKSNPKSSISKAKAKQVDQQPSPKTAISDPLLLKKLIEEKGQEWYQ